MKKKLRRKAFVIQKVFLPDFISNHSKSIFFVVLMFVGQKNIYSNIDLPHFTLSSSNPPRPLCLWLILFYFYLFCYFFLYQPSFSLSTDKYLNIINIKLFIFLWRKFSYKIGYCRVGESKDTHPHKYQAQGSNRGWGHVRGQTRSIIEAHSCRWRRQR